MAKRSTIGENPLDAVNQEHPLDTVVPDLSGRTGRGNRRKWTPRCWRAWPNWKPASRR